MSIWIELPVSAWKNSKRRSGERPAMSLDCIGWAFDQQDVPRTHRYVLVRLAWHADRNTLTCYPSLTHLAIKTGFNRSTVARSIKWLVENDYVERIGLHQGRSMTYRLRAAERDQSQTATSRPVQPVAESSKGSRRAQPEVVAGSDPKQSIEPSVNRQSRRERKMDEAVEDFKTQYEKNREIPYGSTNGKSGDYVQLASLRKRLNIPSGASPKSWRQALTNYFATPQATYTLADLCVRYDTFLKSALDRFNKPIGADDGKSKETLWQHNCRVAGIADPFVRDDSGGTS